MAIRPMAIAPININMGAWCDRVLYQTPGNDGLSIVNRARAVSLVFGVALAGLIGWCLVRDVILAQPNERAPS